MEAPIPRTIAPFPAAQAFAGRMSQASFIQVDGLHKHYRDGKGNDLHILRGVTLAVAAGESVSIMGASGAGKSTLLHLLGALDVPDQGSIRIDDREIATLDDEKGARFRNETIGFVFQFHHLLMDFTALENVMIPMWIRAGRTLPLQDAARELLEQVGLGERAHHRPSELSGGEQQRRVTAAPSEATTEPLELPGIPSCIGNSVDVAGDELPYVPVLIAGDDHQPVAQTLPQAVYQGQRHHAIAKVIGRMNDQAGGIVECRRLQLGRPVPECRIAHRPGRLDGQRPGLSGLAVQKKAHIGNNNASPRNVLVSANARS